MILELLVSIIFGLIAGIIVNMLADELPYRRNPGIPRYPNGAQRPVQAWSGIMAFALGLRKPSATSNPNVEQSRPHQESGQLSWRYPLTEIFIMLLMFITFRTVAATDDGNIQQTILYLIYMGIFALIFVIDMEHHLILFVVIVPSVLLAFLDALLVPIPSPGISDSMLGAAFGFGFFYLIYLGGYAFSWYMEKFRNKRIGTVAFGFGDVMMATFTGALLGLVYMPLAIVLTLLLGAVGAALYLIAKRILSGQASLMSAIPYGPYIVIATILVLLYPERIWTLIVG